MTGPTVLLDCPRCGEELRIPISIVEEGTPDERGYYVSLDCEDIQHRCEVKRPPNRPRGPRP